MWTELIKFVGGSAVLLAVVAWLIRKIISHQLDKDVEKYKYELKRQGDKELETIKSTLNLEALTHQIRYSKLHEKRAGLIEKLYQKIVALEIAKNGFELELHFQKFDKIKETSKTFLDLYLELSGFINTNRIYFSDNLIHSIKGFQSDPFQILVQMHDDLKPENISSFIQEYEKNKIPFRKTNKNIRETIEKEFRLLLGVK